MKQYQQWLGQYLVSRRTGDHVMAADLARAICHFWQARGNDAERRKWEEVLQEHSKQIR